MVLKLLLCLLVAAIPCRAMTVDEILDKMEAVSTPETARSEITQTVYSPDGRESVSRLLSYSFNGDEKSLMEYKLPARIKGMKILMLNEGDDIWFYSARTGRVRKIASHQKNQSVSGSDFSYEDLSTKDHREKYDCSLAGTEKLDGAECYRIDMTARSGKEIYSRIVFLVDSETFVARAGRFFDEDGEFWKELTLSGIEKTGKYYTASSIEMKNILKGSRTVMKIDSAEYDIELEESLFSERNLKR